MMLITFLPDLKEMLKRFSNFKEMLQKLRNVSKYKEMFKNQRNVNGMLESFKPNPIIHAENLRSKQLCRMI